MAEDVAASFLDDIRHMMRNYRSMGEKAMAQLDAGQVFVTLDPESNSVALIVKHLAGNMRSRFTDFLTTDGEKPDRDRDAEFELGTGTTRAEVEEWWRRGWEVVFGALDALRPEHVLATVTIRGESLTVMQALNRQATHYAYHVGQIVFLAKHLRGQAWTSLSIPRGQSRAHARGTYLRG
jgi:hypothetical protein